MFIGYPRVSTKDQNLDFQIDALKNAGCSKKDIFMDTVSESNTERKGLADAISHLREGDTLVIWKLDRLGRSLIDLITIVNKLHGDGIGFKKYSRFNRHKYALRKTVLQYFRGFCRV